MAPASAITAATESAVENPSMKRLRASRSVADLRCAMIAPISAIPIEPPTWRDAFRTAEPTPDLSTGTDRIAAAALGVIVERHAEAAEQEARAGGSRRSRRASSREKYRSWADEQRHPATS